MTRTNEPTPLDTIKRARELRSQGLTLRAIERRMTAEGHKITYVTIRKYTRDLYTRPQAKTREQKRATRRAWYARNAKRINQELREARANESATERAERLKYERLIRFINKEPAQ